MWRDKVVEEVRAARRKVLKRAGGDLESLVRYLQEREAKSSRRFVQRKPRRIGGSRRERS